MWWRGPESWKWMPPSMVCACTTEPVLESVRKWLP
jgi:hypothetical protein